MLQKFIDHIQKTTQPLITEVSGSTFRITSDGDVKEILPTIFHPNTLTLNSLDALIKMVKTEASEQDAPLYITIPDHMTVRCFGQPDAAERYYRQVYYEANSTDVPGWAEKKSLGFEEAQIALRTRFQETPGYAVCDEAGQRHFPGRKSHLQRQRHRYHYHHPEGRRSADQRAD